MNNSHKYKTYFKIQRIYGLTTHKYYELNNIITKE